jgi:hypothetical protein
MVSWVQRGGPLAEFADGYRDELACRGFTANSIMTHVVLMGQLSSWMAEVRFGVGALTPARIEEFLDSRRAGGPRRVPTAQVLDPLLAHLRRPGPGPRGWPARRPPGGSARALRAPPGGRQGSGRFDGRGLCRGCPAVLVRARVGYGRRDRRGWPVRRRDHRVLVAGVRPARKRHQPAARQSRPAPGGAAWRRGWSGPGPA